MDNLETIFFIVDIVLFISLEKIENVCRRAVTTVCFQNKQNKIQNDVLDFRRRCFYLLQYRSNKKGRYYYEVVYQSNDANVT